MKSTLLLTLVLLLTVVQSCTEQQKSNGTVLCLHPENPNYFMFQGNPILLISSAEHYGALMNKAFDYVRYLNTLHEEGMNYTRLFTGPYSETGSLFFWISNNTMNPSPENWITPWERDPETGIFNLEVWDQEYFERLRSFITLAAEREIVVELTLFSSYYADAHWFNSPFYFNRNLSDLDSIPLQRSNTLYNGNLIHYQEKYVRKIVREVNSFPNILFEIQNEPWSDNPNLAAYLNDSDTLINTQPWQKRAERANHVSLEWQKRIAGIIRDEEDHLPNRHLIAQNISNYTDKIDSFNPDISIFNFHYAHPEAASDNLFLERAISLDETGFMPHNDFLYRRQAWMFILSGGACYNNLDYSFIVGKEDGTAAIDDKTPGWGGTGYRKQLKILKDLMEGMDFIHMNPAPEMIPEEFSGKIRILASKGRQYAVYICGENPELLSLDLPSGTYTINWISPVTGLLKESDVTANPDSTLMVVPEFEEDIALVIKRK